MLVLELGPGMEGDTISTLYPFSVSVLCVLDDDDDEAEADPAD